MHEHEVFGRLAEVAADTGVEHPGHGLR
jgi:hypothetical protein